jgi:hypothetical protein
MNFHKYISSSSNNHTHHHCVTTHVSCFVCCLTSVIQCLYLLLWVPVCHWRKQESKGLYYIYMKPHSLPKYKIQYWSNHFCSGGIVVAAQLLLSHVIFNTCSIKTGSINVSVLLYSCIAFYKSF